MSRKRGAEPTASIDDLLSLGDDYDEQPAPLPAARRRWPWAWLVRVLLLAGLSTLLVVAGLLAVGLRVSPVGVFAGALALLLLRRVVAALAAPPVPRERARAGGSTADEEGRYDWRGYDALRVAVRRWEARLETAQSDPARFSRTVLPVLAELADERLRQRHGLTRSSDPRRARDLLGESLWRLLSEPGQPPKRRDLAAHVQTLEKL